MLGQEFLDVAESEADAPAEVVGAQLSVPDEPIDGVRVDGEETGELLAREQRVYRQLGGRPGLRLRP
jgi:hypothetical protein